MAANQTATFARTDYDLGKQPAHLTIADVNGDGRLDIVATYSGDKTASVLLGGVDGDGKQTFQPPIDYTGPIPDSPPPAVDLDGDGNPDLVSLVSGIVNGAYTDAVSVQFGNGVDSQGKPTYRPAAFYEAGNLPITLAIADFNGDGRLDIATICVNNGPLFLLFGTVDAEGKLTFLPKENCPTGAMNIVPFDIVAADINADGKPDLVLANEFDGPPD